MRPRNLALPVAAALMPVICGIATGKAAPAPSVRSLYADCRGQDLKFCEGYLSGVAQALERQRAYDEKWSENYCPPRTAPAPELRGIFVRWAERSSFWEVDPYDGALITFSIAFFCPVQ